MTRFTDSQSVTRFPIGDALPNRRRSPNRSNVCLRFQIGDVRQIGQRLPIGNTFTDQQQSRSAIRLSNRRLANLADKRQSNAAAPL